MKKSNLSFALCSIVCALPQLALAGGYELGKSYPLLSCKGAPAAQLGDDATIDASASHSWPGRGVTGLVEALEISAVVEDRGTHKAVMTSISGQVRTAEFEGAFQFPALRSSLLTERSDGTLDTIEIEQDAAKPRGPEGQKLAGNLGFVVLDNLNARESHRDRVWLSVNGKLWVASDCETDLDSIEALSGLILTDD
jgi:hypothetical protein